MNYTFENIGPNFNPKSEIYRLRINLAPGSEGQFTPIIEAHNTSDESYLDKFSETLYYKIPRYIISYIYGSGVRLVVFELKIVEQTNAIQFQIVYPPHLSTGSSQFQPFRKVIEPEFLFKNIKLDFTLSDYEGVLNPMRYRNVLINAAIK